MNARVLELIKNPDLFQNQDLEILESEIKKHPYIQNIRALHLFGTHRFQPEEYQNALSTTAAYTTDKKILYQFINRTSVAEKAALPIKDTQILTVTENKNTISGHQFNQIRLEPKPQSKPVFVNGVLNRILFEGEENFLEQKTEVLDIESTMESGQIVTQSTETESAKNENINENIENQSEAEILKPEDLTPERTDSENEYQEEKPSEEIPSEISFHETEDNQPEIQPESSEKEEINEVQAPFKPQTSADENKTGPTDRNSSQISFHGTEEFLPEVQIASSSSLPKAYEVPKPPLNKNEVEMQRLIAEVEAKMKSGKKEKIKEADEVHVNTDLDFFETQNFDVVKTEEETISKKNSVTEKEAIAEQIQEIGENSEETFRKPVKIIQNDTSADKKEWKPMSFSGNTPDALIDKKEKETPEQKIVPAEAVTAKTETIAEQVAEEKAEERPVFNVSFFAQKVSSIESEPVEKPVAEKVAPKAEIEESNIPTFINTWQNWLKIDRNQPTLEEQPIISKEEVKNKVIENFIVKEPRISKLKEESDFVVKEKGDNISHLMTETLAKLYIEQKLYSKAIKAYQILSQKHPEKKSHFEEQISHIKELRQNKQP